MTTLASSHTLPDGASNTMRVLIVDDSRVMRMLLRRMVNELGIDDVVEAGNGQEALERVDSHVPDLAMVDWNMPVMNGLDFVSALRERRDCDRVKVIMVTSESDPRQIYEALKAGADEYAMKPIDREILADKLQLMGLG
jgi:two-component system chemotaxis response regulator CheY